MALGLQSVNPRRACARGLLYVLYILTAETRAAQRIQSTCIRSLKVTGYCRIPTRHGICCLSVTTLAATSLVSTLKRGMYGFIFN